MVRRSCAICIGVRLSSPVFSLQLCQQRLGLLEVRGVKALGEPAVDRREQRTGFGLLALLLPEAAEAHRRPQLQRFRLLLAGHGYGLLEARCRLSRMRVAGWR